MTTWQLYDPAASDREKVVDLPKPPPWRQAGRARESVLAETFTPRQELVDAVNTALYLRRPLLITGQPGTGKSSLIHSVARKLCLGNVIEWAINSRSTLQEGLYRYDALGRLQAIQQLAAKGGDIPDAGEGLGKFLTLGPLGTALASSANASRALLVDEVDKSDIDLPNDLLNVLDTGRFVIPELRREAGDSIVTVTGSDGEPVDIRNGTVTFTEFPFVVMTSNGERDFPAAFLRRCVQCRIKEPDSTELLKIVAAHFPNTTLPAEEEKIVADFIKLRESLQMATDQLLNAVHVLHLKGAADFDLDRDRLTRTLFQKLG